MIKSPRDDETHFNEFATRFLGYGSLKAPVWLVGPEAGGGATVSEIHKRVAVWKERGGQDCEDLQSYHKALELPSEADWTKNEQPTWAALIRILMGLGATDSGKNGVLQFQVEALGKQDGDFCVLDVSQISCPVASGWILGTIGIDWLETRESYEAKILPTRCTRFKSLLNEFEPSLVIFYGTGEKAQTFWRGIADVEGDWRELSLPPDYEVAWARLRPKLSWAWRGNSLCIWIPHPVGGIWTRGKGSRSRFYKGLGKAIHEKLGRHESRVVGAIKRWQRNPKSGDAA